MEPMPPDHRPRRIANVRDYDPTPPPADLTVCRVNVSGAFFLSIEFQQTGYLVERVYKVAFGDATAISNIGGSHQILVPVVRANEFLTDTQRIGRGVIVLQPGWARQ